MPQRDSGAFKGDWGSEVAKSGDDVQALLASRWHLIPQKGTARILGKPTADDVLTDRMQVRLVFGAAGVFVQDCEAKVGACACLKACS